MTPEARVRLREELTAVHVQLTDEEFERFVGVVEDLRDGPSYRLGTGAGGGSAAAPRSASDHGDNSTPAASGAEPAAASTGGAAQGADAEGMPAEVG